MEVRSEAVITNVDSDGFLWIQIGNTGEFRRFRNKLTLLCSQPTNPIVSPAKNQMCVVRSKKWRTVCRARVERILPDEKTAELFYVDYGDTERMPLNLLSLSPATIQQPLPFAKKCALHNVDVSSVGWTAEVKSLIAANKNVTVEFKGTLEQSDVSSVVLYGSSSERVGVISINEELQERLFQSQKHHQAAEKHLFTSTPSWPLSCTPTKPKPIPKPKPKPKQSLHPTNAEKNSPSQRPGPCKAEIHGMAVEPLLAPSRSALSSPEIGSDDVFVYGGKCQSPVLSFQEMPFSPSICECLKARCFRDPKPIQAYCWRPIFRGADMVAVSPPQSGKTLAYLLPLLTHINNQKAYESLPAGNGPLVVILSPFWEKATFVYKQAQAYLMSKSSKTLLLYGAETDESDWLSLLRGCDVLVATPHCFLKAIKQNYTDLARIAHMVFDDANILTEEFTHQIKSVLHELSEAMKKRLESGKGMTVPCQKLIFSSSWTAAVESLANACLSSPMIVLASKFYAAVYWKIKQVVHWAQSGHTLCKIVEDLVKEHQNILILTCNGKETMMAEEVLKQLPVSLMCAFYQLNVSELDKIKQSWNSQSNPWKILICEESLFSFLDISNVSAMIHINFPLTRRLFTEHLMALKKVASSGKPCVSHVILNEASGFCLPLTVELLLAFGCHIEEELKTKARKIIKAIEKTKQFLPISKELLAFGRLKMLGLSGSRQTIWPDWDSPSFPGAAQLPSSGSPKLKILHVEDASCYWARLLESEDKCITSNSSSLLLELQSCGKQSCLPLIKHFQEGIVCGWKGRDSACYRVEIKDQKQVEGSEIECFLIDHGSIKVVSKDELFELPEELQQQPPLAFRVFLCGIQPANNDRSWTPEADALIRGLIEEKEMTGKIALALRNILFVSSLVQPCRLEAINVTDCDLNVKRLLIRDGYAELNSKHVRVLRHVAGSLSPPQQEESSAIEPDFMKVENVFERVNCVSLPEEGHVDVFISAVSSPHKFHVEVISELKKLNELIDELNAEIESGGMKANSESLHIGSYCLAKFKEDGRWYRARIQRREGSKYHVYFVDHGDTGEVSHKKIKPIKPEWLQLPVQAVECSLAGIEPTGEDWSDKAGDILWDVSRDKALLAEVRRVHVSDEQKSIKYEIDLLDTSGGNCVNVTQHLIEAGAALLHTHILEQGGDGQSQHWSYKLSSLSLAVLKAKSLEDQVKNAEKLRCLAFENMKSKEEVQVHDGLTYLLSLVKTGSLKEEVLKHALFGFASLLFNSKENCQVVLKKGGLKSFLRLLSPSCSPTIQHCCLWIIQSFLDVRGVSDTIREDGGLKCLCTLLSQSPDSKVQSRLCTILQKLCSTSARNCVVVLAERGVKLILGLISSSPSDQVKEEAASALEALMTCHSRCKDSFRVNAGIPILCSNLETSSNKDLIELILKIFLLAVSDNLANVKSLLRSEVNERLVRLSGRLSGRLQSSERSISRLCSELGERMKEEKAKLGTAKTPPALAQKRRHSPSAVKTATPFVKWWQTLDVVYVKIIQRDASFGKRNVEFRFGQKEFTFRALVNDVKFILNLDLYGKVNAEACLAKQGCVFELKKEEQGKMWPRLITSDVKVPHIPVNFDHLLYYSDDDEDGGGGGSNEKPKMTSEEKGKKGGKYDVGPEEMIPDESSSEDSESDCDLSD